MINGLESQDIDPTVDRCPICNKDLSGTTYEYRRKHIARCRRSKPTHFYSDRPRGRPSTKKHIKSPSKMLCLSMALILGLIVFKLIFHFP